MSSALASYAQINPRLTPSDLLVFELPDPAFAGVTYVITDAYCVQPTCPCRLVSLQLERLPDGPEDRDPDPERFFMHLDTLELLDAAGQPLDLERFPLAASLKAELPESAIALWRAHYEQGRRYGLENSWRHKHWNDLRPGDMIAWTEIREAEPVWSLEHDGQRYVAIDRYCPSPVCDCREALISFVAPTEAEGEAEEALVRITLKGESELEDAGNLAPALVQQLLRTFRQRAGLMRDLRDRYQHVKKVGTALAQRYPELAAGWGMRREASISAQLEPDNLPRFKVGRNDPCPCGSGRKFKQCCGKN